MTDQRCENCRFWCYSDGNDGMILGWCRRYPPSIVADQMPSVESDHYTNPYTGIFPETSGTDWCGEWQGKEGEKQHGIAANS